MTTKLTRLEFYDKFMSYNKIQVDFKNYTAFTMLIYAIFAICAMSKTLQKNLKFNYDPCHKTSKTNFKI